MGDDEAATRSPAEVFDLTARACDAYGRSDLAGIVEAARHRHAAPHVRVVVVGEFKQGKSTLVNALLGAEVCATDDDVPTTVPTVVHHAEVEAALAVHLDDDGDERREPLEPAALRATLTAPPSADGPITVEVGLPRRLLRLGLEIVDTPGVGGLVSAHAVAARAAAARADAVLFVSDALAELTASEVQVLDELAGAAGAVALAMPKVDIAPAWAALVERNRAHLAARDLAVRILPLAAPLRHAALAQRDSVLNTESGYDKLAAWLTGLARTRTVLADRTARAELTRVIADLEVPLRHERDVLEDPSRAAALRDELQAARQRAEQLEASGWQQLLADRVSDVTSAVDHDLRLRLRTLGRDADTQLEQLDPAEVWDELEPVLRRQVAEAVVAVVAGLEGRTRALVAEVLQRVADDEGVDEVGVPLDAEVLAAPHDTLARLSNLQLDTSKAGLLATGMTALRGMQGGALMFGMMGNLVGLSIAGPALIGIGLVMGGRALVEEQRRQLTARRQQARQAVRTHLDDVAFHVGKDVRDALRLLQRGLRDALGLRAATARRTAQAALQAADQAATTDHRDAAARRADLEAELDRIDRLRAEVDTVFAAGVRR